jgi:hypothetical protein
MNEDSPTSHFGNMKSRFGFQALKQLALFRPTEELLVVSEEPKTATGSLCERVFVEDRVEPVYGTGRGRFPSYGQIFQTLIEEIRAARAYPHPNSIGDK